MVVFDDFRDHQISGLNNIEMQQISDFSSYFGVHQIFDLINVEVHWISELNSSGVHQNSDLNNFEVHHIFTDRTLPEYNMPRPLSGSFFR